MPRIVEEGILGYGSSSGRLGYGGGKSNETPLVAGVGRVRGGCLVVDLRWVGALLGGTGFPLGSENDPRTSVSFESGGVELLGYLPPCDREGHVGKLGSRLQRHPGPALPQRGTVRRDDRKEYLK